MPWWSIHQYRELWDYSGGRLFLPFLIPVALWSLIWKGLALYKAARNEHKGWFVALLIINTAGILEIVYFLLFSNPPKKKKAK
jgi:hypothetical protein